MVSPYKSARSTASLTLHLIFHTGTSEQSFSDFLIENFQLHFFPCLICYARCAHSPLPCWIDERKVSSTILLSSLKMNNTWSDTKNKTNPIAQEPRVEGERQTDGCRTCYDLLQYYKAQLDCFTQYVCTHLEVQTCSYPRLENVGLQKWTS